MIIKTNINFDLNQFEKIEDIIYLDEPILSHLKKNAKDYLFYLVDTVEDRDSYLLIEVEKDTIFKYLTGQITLRSIITSSPEYILEIEQDFHGNIIEVRFTQNNLVSDAYLPAEDSFLIYEPSENSYYYNFINEYERQFYLLKLRRKAFYLKLVPTNSKYAETIGFNELVKDLLKNISASHISFLQADFFMNFKDKIADKLKLKKIYSQIVESLDFRVVDLNFGSFEVGLSVDTVMKQGIENKEIREWAIDVGYKYKNIVLDNDFNDEKIANLIADYSEEDRKKIFEPIFKITENPNFDFKIKDSIKGKYQRIRIKDKNKIERIIPPKPIVIEVEAPKEYEFLKLTTIQLKNQKTKSIKLDQDTLFETSSTNEFVLKNSDFEKYEFHLDYEIAVKVDILTEGGFAVFTAIYENQPFEVIIDASKYTEGIKIMIGKIYDYTLNTEFP